MAEASEITICPCCGKGSADTGAGELCSECVQAMESPGASAPGPKIRPPFSPVTYTLIAINVVVFALKITPKGKYQDIFEALDNYGPDTLSGQWWRLLTSCFLHGDCWHLLGNLLPLWILGRRAERLFGSGTFLLMYLASVIAASVASLAVHPESAAHGSSAIVLALIGALICKYGLMGAQLSTRARWKLALLIILAGLLSYPINPSSDVDYAAHAGGLVAGMLLGGLLSSAFFAAQPRQRRWLWAGTALALALGCAVIRRNNHYVIPLEAALHDWDPRKPDETLRAVDPILQQRPLSRTANLMAADAYLRKADYANAEGAARRVLASGRDNDLAIYVLGMAEIKTGRCQEAHDMAQEKLMSHDNGESWPWTQRLSRVRCGEKETTGDK